MEKTTPPAATGQWDDYPRCIFGEAVNMGTPDGFAQCVYLTHTAFPRFLCELLEDDELLDETSNLAGKWVGQGAERHWACNAGFLVQKFVFLESVTPTDDDLTEALMNVALDFQIWTDEYGQFGTSRA